LNIRVFREYGRMDDSYTGQSSGVNVDVYEKTTEEMLLAEMK